MDIDNKTAIGTRLFPTLSYSICETVVLYAVLGPDTLDFTRKLDASLMLEGDCVLSGHINSVISLALSPSIC